MRITKRESVKLKSSLPKGAVSKIVTRMNKKVGSRMVQMILSGTAEDIHGVIDYAIDLAIKEKERRKSLNKKISEL